MQQNHHEFAFHVPSFVRVPIVAGSSPAKRFSAIQRLTRLESNPISSGIVPEKKLLLILNDSKLRAPFTISLKTCPCSKLRSMSNSFKLTSASKMGGTTSSKLLSEKFKTSSPVRALISFGKAPTRLLFSLDSVSE